jgi:hypothetical protein
MARASDLFRAGVDFHGVHNWVTELGIPPTEPDYRVAPESPPLAYIRGWRSPVLLIQGDDDRDVQFGQTVMLADALRQQKVEVEELVFPDEVHEFLLHKSWLETYRAAIRFLERGICRLVRYRSARQQPLPARAQRPPKAARKRLQQVAQPRPVQFLANLVI